MRPIADGKDAHDVDLQGDHRAGAQADGEIEGETTARLEFDVGRADNCRGRVDALVHTQVPCRRFFGVAPRATSARGQAPLGAPINCCECP